MKFFIISSVTFVLAFQAFSQSRTDPIYYSENWDVCEKPFANSYRIGKMIIDTFWFFKGPVQDYYMNGKLRMEGNYDELGYKNGSFKSYYENGNPKYTGQYKNDSMYGKWNFFYPDGKEKAEIIFEGGDFSFTKYVDSNGIELLKDGSGKFVWPINETPFRYNYILEGEFLNGKRHGDWKYYSYLYETREKQFKEEYEKGKFKKGISYTVLNDIRNKKPVTINMVSYELVGAERFEADIYFDSHINGDKLFDYLVNQKPVLFTNTSTTFEGSLQFVIKTLSECKAKFDYGNKKYEGKIMFLLDEKGIPKNISIEGNVSEKEKEILSFLVAKFRNLQMPGDDKVGIEKYHTIYFFSVDFKEYAKNSEIEMKEFFFSFLPPEQAKKNIKFINK